jgi:large subunit ribosomal protein L6
VADRRVMVKGPLGESEHTLPGELGVAYQKEAHRLVVERTRETRKARALHGLHRSLLANKVTGVSVGFAKAMEVYGTGYSADLRGDVLVLQLGFCHEVTFALPEGISVEVVQRNAQLDNPARFVVKGVDKEQVGQFAASVRAARPPEPYKGKGVRYSGEYVRRKEGKALAGL